MALSPEQITELRQKYAIGSSVATSTPTNSFGEKIKGEVTGLFKSYVSKLNQQYGSYPSQFATDVKQSSADIEKGGVGNFIKGTTKAALRTAGDTAGAVFAPISAAIGTGLERAGEALPEVKDTIEGGINFVADKISDIPEVQQFAMRHPEAGKDFERVLNIIAATGMKGKSGEINPTRMASEVKATVTNPVGTAKQTVSAGVSAVKNAGASVVDTVTKRPSEIIGKTQNYLSRKNVGENFDTSIRRISEKGDPLAKYDEFYKQEQAYKNDAKQDMAINKVGERIGEAYDQVIKQRQEVGKKMGAEIEKIGGKKTDISESLKNFEAELKKQGLEYNTTLPRQGNRTSKMSTQDTQLINEYLRDLNKLGSNPTVAELDAFLSRVPREIDAFNSTNNVTKVTNGERIITNHLKKLRENLSPEKDPSFAEYYEARKDYHELSDFLDEGSRFLGGKSQAGDYVKDASLAKSAVQSVLENGKKDWLLKLEDLTGYQAIDDSVLALQAMKDAGNFKGRSLLDLLSEGQEIPTSIKGIKDKVLEKAFEVGADKFVGTPAEQTRRVIMERMQQGKTEVPTQFETPTIETKKPNTQGGYIKNPFGDTKNTVSPESVVKKLDLEDVFAIKTFLDEGGEIQTFINSQPMLEAMGITGLEAAMQKRFLQEVFDLAKTRFKPSGE